MSTYFPSSHDITRKWFVIDASGKTLGRLATEAASTLSGKNNPKYTPFIDMGDHVVVVNAEKIVLTGLKSQQKVYRRYTGFPGVRDHANRFRRHAKNSWLPSVPVICDGTIPITA
jgi:large subunit ribosomal protein L13